MPYQYTVAEISRDHHTKPRDRDLIRQDLENTLNHYAEQGWEYQSMDSMRIYEPPGCIAASFGSQGTWSHVYMAIFRRPLA